MIIMDTGPLIGLIDPRDGLHVRSRADLEKLAGQPMLVTTPVLTEVLFFLRTQIARQKLVALLDQLNVTIKDVADPAIRSAFDWMNAYAQHDPDFTDAVTVVLSQEINAATVWTYDSEFRAIWRKPDGSAIPLAVKL
jgi:predicted nucleic acid-binding protein